MSDWYVIEIYTEKSREVSEGFGSLIKAEAFAEATRTNPGVLSATVLHSRKPNTSYDGPTTGKISPNIYDERTWGQYGSAYAVHADTGSDWTSDLGNTVGDLWFQIPWTERHAVALDPTVNLDEWTTAWHTSHPRPPLRSHLSNAEKGAWAKTHPNPFDYRGVE